MTTRIGIDAAAIAASNLALAHATILAAKGPGRTEKIDGEAFAQNQFAAYFAFLRGFDPGSGGR